MHRAPRARSGPMLDATGARGILIVRRKARMRRFIMIAALLTLLGCREKADPALGTLLQKAMNDLQRKTAYHQAAWGLGKSEKWNLKQEDGRLILTFHDKIVTCNLEI